MNCDDIASLLDDATIFDASPVQQEEVDAHLVTCESCCHAWRATHALRAWRDSPDSAPRPELFAEVVHRTTRPAASRARRNGFLAGAGIGGALAASIVMAVMTLFPMREDPAGAAIPALTIALNEPYDVSVAIDSGEALSAAEIRVVLTGDIRLAGFGDQSVVSWTTNLDPGLNRLTLPVVAIRPTGGQLLVEVAHHSKRQIFVVNVGVAPEAVLGQPLPAAGREPAVDSREPLRGSAV